MTRIQILELPEGAGDERPPFVLVVDECAPQRRVLGAEAVAGDYWQAIADRIGARGVVVTPDTIDIPANEVALSDVVDGNVVRFRVEPDFAGFTDKVMAEVARTEPGGLDALRSGLR